MEAKRKELALPALKAKLTELKTTILQLLPAKQIGATAVLQDKHEMHNRTIQLKSKIQKSQYPNTAHTN